jgi:hypothetical protein
MPLSKKYIESSAGAQNYNFSFSYFPATQGIFKSEDELGELFMIKYFRSN